MSVRQTNDTPSRARYNDFPVMLHYMLLVVAATSALTAAADWPQFRGPGSAGVVEDQQVPESWSKTENVAWTTPIPGLGWSSPIIAHGHVYLTSVISSKDVEPPKKGLYFGGERPAPKDEHRAMLYAVDLKTGKIAWEREVWRGIPPFSRHLKNSFASETPAADGERVYAYFGQLGLFCFDKAGKPLWSRKLEPVNTRYGWGTASSPVLDENRVYFVNDNDTKSYLTALDKKTGAVIWTVERDEKTNWATPYIWKHDGHAEIITPGTGKTRSYDLDGKLLWEFSGMSSITIPTPFSKFGLLYVTSGYVGDPNRPVYVVKPGAKGDITLPKGASSSDAVAWYLPQAGPYNPSPIVYGDLYYTLLDRGFVTAHDARTGKEIYSKQRIDPSTTAFTASPWAANGKLFALSEDGDTYVIQTGPEFKVLGKNSLDELCMSTPAIADGNLVIRTASNLLCIRKR
jgi:outer membrane protein assembly factor BamB